MCLVSGRVKRSIYVTEIGCVVEGLCLPSCLPHMWYVSKSMCVSPSLRAGASRACSRVLTHFVSLLHVV